MTRLRPLWPYAVLFLFALLAAEPLAREQMTCSDDGAFHLYRAVQLEWLLQAGHWIPGWSPHMAQGYGLPFFIFTAPLSSYFVVGLRALGFEFPLALRIAFGITIWLAGCAAFVYARSVWGERAGLVAGAAYLLAPYFAFDILYRANLAESFAFIWLPVVLWGLQRLRTQTGRSQFGATLLPALGFAALSLSHNVFAFVAAPLLASYGVMQAWQMRSWRLGFWGALALGVGAALSAYYWLPALAERELIHFERLAVPPIFTWYTNFVDLKELLAAPQIEDPLFINPSPAKGLGLTAALLCLPALGSVLFRSGTGRGETAFFLLAVAGYGCLTLPFSEPVWRSLSPMQVVQFPWRMLGPAALCAALCIGAGVQSLERVRAFGRWPALMVAALFVLGNWSVWYPRYCASPSRVSLSDMLEYEQATATIGTTAKGEFLPRTVDYLPEDGSLAEAILRGEEPDRLLVLEGEAEFSDTRTRDPLDAAYTIVARTPATLAYRQFLYPGWQVTADGRPVALRAAPGTGLITFDLPVGTHSLHIVFGSTPLRDFARFLSLTAVIVLMAIGARGRGHSMTSLPPQPAGVVWDLGLFALALLVAKLAIIDRVPNPLRHTRFDGVTVAGVATPLRTDFAGGLRLYGYDSLTRTMPSDGGTDVVFYVGKREPNLREFTPVFVAHDSAGVNWVGADAFIPPRWHREPPPSYGWPDDAYAQWARRVTVLPGTPPGEYELKMELIDRSDGAMQSVLDEQGNAVQPRVSFGSVTVTRPQRPFILQPESVVNGALGPLTLLGYNVDQTSVNAGDTVLLTLYWRSDQPMDIDYSIRLRVGADYTVDLSPVAGFGTSRWQVGDQWRGQHRVTVPANLPDGPQALQIELISEGATQLLGTLTVTAPQRGFEAPGVETVSGATFEGVGELVGYTLKREGNTLTVQLVWKATATPAQRYSVFVHLVGDTSRVWAQSDSAPAGGARPSTGWLAGEYIVDEHTLTLPDDLPPGEYALFVGLYDPLTTQRVAATGRGADADNRVRIGAVILP